jgi:hypothetical protein
VSLSRSASGPLNRAGMLNSQGKEVVDCKNNFGLEKRLVDDGQNLSWQRCPSNVKRRRLGHRLGKRSAGGRHSLASAEFRNTVDPPHTASHCAVPSQPFIAAPLLSPQRQLRVFETPCLAACRSPCVAARDVLPRCRTQEPKPGISPMPVDEKSHRNPAQCATIRGWHLDAPVRRWTTPQPSRHA